MKKKILILFLAVLVVGSICLAEETKEKPPALFDAFRISLISMNYADYSSSMAAVALDRNIYERNLLMRKPLIGVCLCLQSVLLSNPGD